MGSPAASASGAVCFASDDLQGDRKIDYRSRERENVEISTFNQVG